MTGRARECAWALDVAAALPLDLPPVRHHDPDP